MLQVLQWPSCLQEKGFETHILDLFGNAVSFSLLLPLKVKVVLVARRKEKLAEVNGKMMIPTVFIASKGLEIFYSEMAKWYREQENTENQYTIDALALSTHSDNT